MTAAAPAHNGEVVIDVHGLTKRYDGVTGAFIDNFISAGSGGLSGGYWLTFGGHLTVGGLVTGLSPKKGTVICQNLTTHKVVRIPLDVTTSWNCEDAGLVVSPGDRMDIQLQIKGAAQ